MGTSKNQNAGRGRGINLGKSWYLKGSDTQVRRAMTLVGGKRRLIWVEVLGPGSTGRVVEKHEMERR